ncbi:hypothetical protein RFI_02187 [Reticulomyxa filosa]|uniref:Uncharacterized protein n=1 Tax=Reticulomyxa filosa TaxID=46433 RepID=X6PA28_RETFI|nr:hypothetical protein RFI_02187 [Reticulomyxa filosa]|eukprot:ETO34904.1 hypothetical protein RFI_02187 [Reticulomyxa filosa]
MCEKYLASICNFYSFHICFYFFSSSLEIFATDLKLDKTKQKGDQTIRGLVVFIIGISYFEQDILHDRVVFVWYVSLRLYVEKKQRGNANVNIFFYFELLDSSQLLAMVYRWGQKMSAQNVLDHFLPWQQCVNSLLQNSLESVDKNQQDKAKRDALNVLLKNNEMVEFFLQFLSENCAISQLLRQYKDGTWDDIDNDVEMPDMRQSEMLVQNKRCHTPPLNMVSPALRVFKNRASWPSSQETDNSDDIIPWNLINHANENGNSDAKGLCDEELISQMLDYNSQPNPWIRKQQMKAIASKLQEYATSVQKTNQKSGSSKVIYKKYDEISDINQPAPLTTKQCESILEFCISVLNSSQVLLHRNSLRILQCLCWCYPHVVNAQIQTVSYGLIKCFRESAPTETQELAMDVIAQFCKYVDPAICIDVLLPIIESETELLSPSVAQKHQGKEIVGALCILDRLLVRMPREWLTQHAMKLSSLLLEVNHSQHTCFFFFLSSRSG